MFVYFVSETTETTNNSHIKYIYGP